MFFLLVSLLWHWLGHGSDSAMPRQPELPNPWKGTLRWNPNNRM
ncbi:MAG TPA: hypothetical protein VFZ34_01720 [Blastocatellia bacterium]|nr:hypothetical protein [Blastocatellia bacterium]